MRFRDRGRPSEVIGTMGHAENLTQARQIIYERVYSVYLSTTSGGDGWEYFNTQEEALDRVKTLRPTIHRYQNISVSWTDREKS
jgi:hypothetical protein